MNALKSIAKPISWASLLLIVVPPILYFTDSISKDLMQTLLLVGTIVWFVTASMWIKSE